MVGFCQWYLGTVPEQNGFCRNGFFAAHCWTVPSTVQNLSCLKGHGKNIHFFPPMVMNHSYTVPDHSYTIPDSSYTIPDRSYTVTRPFLTAHKMFLTVRVPFLTIQVPLKPFLTVQDCSVPLMTALFNFFYRNG